MRKTKKVKMEDIAVNDTIVKKQIVYCGTDLDDYVDVLHTVKGNIKIDTVEDLKTLSFTDELGVTIKVSNTEGMVRVIDDERNA